MRRIQNITDEAHQRHILVFEESEITLVLRFYPTVGMWCFDITYKDHTVSGRKLSAGVLHMASANLPFDFVVTDTTNQGLDPTLLTDFATGRCELYLLESADMESYRGRTVEI